MDEGFGPVNVRVAASVAYKFILTAGDLADAMCTLLVRTTGETSLQMLLWCGSVAKLRA